MHIWALLVAPDSVARAGDVSPSAKLPVTLPMSEADLPEPKLSGPPPADFETRYAEGLNVGYKWFDAEKKEPLFPFGFGSLTRRLPTRS